jgi:serine/threonine protein kinase
MDDNNDNHVMNNMNVKLNPNFFDKQMEKLQSSSSSSSTSNVLRGLKNRASSSKVPNNNCSNGTANHTPTTSTLYKPLPFHSRKELALAERSIQKLVEDSRFFPPQAANEDWFQHRSSSNNIAERGIVTKVTTLYESQLQVGRMLGRGGFCQVRLVTINNTNGGKTTSSTRDHNSNEYALKYLQPSNKSKSSFARGAADLAIEARFLSLLSHENIISLHYVSEGTLAETYNCLDVESTQSGNDCFRENNEGPQQPMPELRSYGYFLVLDYLRDTLLQRIQNLYILSMMAHGFAHPKAHHNKHKCHYGQQFTNGSEKKDASTTVPQVHWWNKMLWARNGSLEEEHSKKLAFVQESLKKRLKILKQIALALEYLHSNGIVYRDVKPDNIGFYFKPDCMYSNDEENEGIPKLFDFGLVKELKPSLRKSQPMYHSSHENSYDEENALFKLTGRTGSRRYMSPEVALYKPYNLKADVYSFGILLYETVTLVQPFDGYSLDRHETFVLKGGERPCLLGYTKSCGCWPKELRHLIEDCWADDMRKRPIMSNVVKRLDKCLIEMNESANYYDHSVNSGICYDEENFCLDPLQVCKGMGRAKKRGLLSNMRANFPSAA